MKARKLRKTRAVLTVAFLWVMEVLAAAAIGAVVAAIVVPTVSLKRGNLAFGGEWALVLIAILVAYHYIHKAVFKRLKN